MKLTCKQFMRSEFIFLVHIERLNRTGNPIQMCQTSGRSNSQTIQAKFKAELKARN